MKNLIIIGGGPAALMLAAQIDTNKYRVTLCEKKKTVGRKFLVAGEGGLNITYNSDIERFISNYVPRDFMASILRQFTNDDLRTWFEHLEISTFVGSSNRVFPEKGIKPIEVLKKLVDYIISRNIKFQLNTKWLGWKENGLLNFENTNISDADIVVYALGGASWKVTGSDGAWNKIFKERNIKIQPFTPANCAFEVEWNTDFISTHEGKPLKNIALNYNGQKTKGELVISKFGLEGNAIYALSLKLQEKLTKGETAVLYLDLKPTLTVSQLLSKYRKTSRKKITDILKKELNLNRTAISLLKHFSDKNTFSNPELLANTIKSLPIVIKSSDELEKAISSLGGIAIDEIDTNFQLKKIPNSYVIGEMLDWFAPTGGYLLQGCFSMGFVLAKHLNELKT